VSADTTRTKGFRGEELARAYLKGKGYAILEVNFGLRTGEIDIIAKDGDTIVFVEVKTASGSSFGDPLGWISPRKQQRIARTSFLYVSRHGLHDSPIRFDVVAVGPMRNITHVRDAFVPPDGFFM
jgi:putative endonuclease